LLVLASAVFLCSFFFCNTSGAQLEDLRGDPSATEHYIPDDGYVEVPLDFEFPFYGRTFTNSWMFSNGVVGFLDPTQEPYQGNYGFCCQGYDNTAQRPASMFTLFPLQTDLINYGDGKFMTRGDDESMTYGWYGISEYGRPGSSNNFEAEIYKDGMYQFRYGEIDVQRRTTIGSTGDPFLGQYEQNLYGLPPNAIETITSYALNGMCESDPLYDPNCPGYAEAYAQQQFEQNCMMDPLYDPSCPGYEQAYYVQQCTIDPLYDSGCLGYEEALFEEECSNDPLYDSGCPGYETAFFEYQCEQNPLYDEGCTGYERAYFDYQCSRNALYDSACPGYEQAYFNQQCSNDPLYSSGCPGYEQAFFDQQCSADPLYDSECPGYETAYFNQQCSNDPLYDSSCPGYADAFFDQQCSNNPLYDESCSGYEQAYFDMRCSNDPLYDSSCPGYADAFFDQQCSDNALYGTGCPGYEQAFFDQQCSNDPLYDSACPGYETAYFNQQCSIDTLYNPGCPGYEEAYAEQQLERTCSADPQSDPRCDDYVEPSTNENDNTQIATPSSNPADDFIEPAITGDATIDSVIRNDDTNDIEQQQTVAAVPVPPIEPAPIEKRGPDETEEQQQEQTNEDNENESDEQRSERRKKMKEIAEREARSLAKDMGKAATIEQQQATQARVMSLISFVPDFGSYARKGIPQPTDYYASTSIYDDATIPDSSVGARNGLAQEVLHRRMVDMQYNREGN